jgi:hypothetical protein
MNFWVNKHSVQGMCERNIVVLGRDILQVSIGTGGVSLGSLTLPENHGRYF